MSTSTRLFPALRAALAALLARLAPRADRRSGRPEAAPTLGAFGLLASEGDLHRH